MFGDRRLDALDLASQLLAGGKGSRLHRRLVRDERLAQDVAVFTLPFVGGASINVGWATVRPGRRDRDRRGGLPRGARAARRGGAVSDDELDAGEGADRGRRAGRARARRGARRPAVDVRDAVRRPGAVNTLLPRYLSVTAEQIRDAARAVFRADNRVVLTYVPPKTRPTTRTNGAGSGEEAA